MKTIAITLLAAVAFAEPEAKPKADADWTSAARAGWTRPRCARPSTGLRESLLVEPRSQQWRPETWRPWGPWLSALTTGWRKRMLRGAWVRRPPPSCRVR